MKITTENYGFHVAFKVPNDQSERMESFLDNHQDFMRETHHIEGNVGVVFNININHHSIVYFLLPTPFIFLGNPQTKEKNK